MIGFDGDGNVMGGPGNLDGFGASQSGADAHDSSNTGKYGFGDSPAMQGDISSLTDAISKALGFGPAATPVRTVQPGVSLAPKTSSPFSLSSLVPGNMAATMMAMFTEPDPTRDMSMGTYNSLVDNLGRDPALSLGNLAGVPQYSHEPIDPLAGYGYGEMMQNVPVAGSGAHMGLATGIQNIGGQNLHVGPGYTGDPGEMNPMNQMMFQGGADPYIRKPRNIAQMIGVQ